MKKLALSFCFIAASGAYVWDQWGQKPQGDLLGSALPPDRTQTSSIQPGIGCTTAPAPSAELQPAPIAARERHQTLGSGAMTAGISPADLPKPAADVPVPRARPSFDAGPAQVTRVAMSATTGYIDGIYNGPAADAYYGLIQIQAIVAGGRITGIKVLRYPSDRRTSVQINRQALPMLRDEVVAAQSAHVDIVSGATLTSKAFIRSLNVALQKARS